MATVAQPVAMATTATAPRVSSKLPAACCSVASRQSVPAQVPIILLYFGRKAVIDWAV